MADTVVLSVVLPGHMDRYPFPILHQLHRQASRLNDERGVPVVEVLSIIDNGSLSVGEKMNRLYEMSCGAYVAGVGDDDQISPDYVKKLVSTIEENPGVDLVSFNHHYYVNGTHNALTVVSMGHRDSQVEGLHHRKPTPKCAIRADICRAFVCPKISDKEDQAMSEWLVGRLETEATIEEPIYTHDWDRKNKTWRTEQAKFWRRS